MEQPRLARDVIAAATACLAPERGRAVKPSDGGDWLRPHLYHHRGQDHSHSEYLTVRQQRLWEFLGSMPSGTTVLGAPEGLLGPSSGARAAARAEAERLENVRTIALRETQLSESARLGREREAAQLEARAAPVRTPGRARTDSCARRAGQHARLFAEDKIDQIVQSRTWRATSGLRRLGPRPPPRAARQASGSVGASRHPLACPDPRLPLSPSQPHRRCRRQHRPRPDGPAQRQARPGASGPGDHRGGL